jgi:hypothetical protein
MPAREGLLDPREQALLAAPTHNSLSSQLRVMDEPGSYFKTAFKAYSAQGGLLI